MFIDPRIVIEKGWVKGIVDEKKQVQPNALDFTLDEVHLISATSTFVISEAGKVMRGNSKLEPIPMRDGSGNFWILDYGIYDCLSNVYVELPEGVAAMLVIRSTFNRNGIFLTSGLYDSGYKGHIGFALHVQSPQAYGGTQLGKTKIGTGTRVGQIIFVQADSSGLYAGQYDHLLGTNAPHIGNH